MPRPSSYVEPRVNGFSASAVPEIGVQARAGMARIYATLLETGWSAEQVRDFIAHGMLLNVLVSIGAVPGSSGMPGALGELVEACLPEELRW